MFYPLCPSFNIDNFSFEKVLLRVQWLYPPEQRRDGTTGEARLNSQHSQASQIAGGHLEPTPDRH
jgi:hypothetical protein